MKLQSIIESHWYTKFDPFLGIILFPFSLIYEAIVRIRKFLFKIKLKSSTRLPVPVVIIGNISVGGAGKTPLTKALAEELVSKGINVGIVLRGYKSKNKNAKIVAADDNSTNVGDEALIYAQNGFKAAIGSKRAEAGKLLLATYPETQVILADDGMQHYYLQRDLEICVIDSSRLLGNQQLLPAGPLREPVSRLNSVDFIVVNGSQNQTQLENILSKYKIPIINQELDFECLYNPISGKSVSAQELNNLKLLPMAAIGNPQRFYAYLRDLGIKFDKVKSLPDHHHYQESDIPAGYTIITTEKDYTKLSTFNNPNIWVAKVKAKLNNESIITAILGKINQKAKD